MKFAGIWGAAVLLFGSLVLAQGEVEKSSAKTWNFDSDAVGKPPTGHGYLEAYRCTTVSGHMTTICGIYVGYISS